MEKQEIKNITINGWAIHDIPSFYNEVNRVLMIGEEWELGQSLDAFNDLLYGGFGVISRDEPIILTWSGFEHSREALGTEATRQYLLDKVQPGSPFNKALFKEKLEKLEQGSGETYFETILEIIADHPNITLVPMEGPAC